MITIPIGLDEEIVKKIDALVARGVYKNRTEALREQIVKGIAKLSILSDETIETEKHRIVLKKLLSLPQPPNLLRTERSVADLVSEGRER